MKRSIAFSIIVILGFSIGNPLAINFVELDDSEEIYFQGPISSAVRIEITSPSYSITADEVITFTATLYDSVNSVVSGEITWSSSNGTITNGGTFYPWDSGVIAIQASHGTLYDSCTWDRSVA
jgi:hypothetical protein